jgi:antitoxin (DNA-binding transcriptional repressor) of toxin-antitoxin stability system
MTTRTVEVSEAQIHLRELISLVVGGTEVVLTEGATPRVRLVPIPPTSQPRVAGLHAGAISTTDDFDDPLPEAFWSGDA